MPIAVIPFLFLCPIAFVVGLLSLTARCERYLDEQAAEPAADAAQAPQAPQVTRAPQARVDDPVVDADVDPELAAVSLLS